LFAAPEVVNFDPLSLATDMWSVGVIAFILWVLPSWHCALDCFSQMAWQSHCCLAEVEDWSSIQHYCFCCSISYHFISYHTTFAMAPINQSSAAPHI